MSDLPMPEPLDEFLQSPPTARLDPDLQAELLRRTIGLMPRRRRWRRGPIVAAVAASIVLALVSGYFIFRPPDKLPLPRHEVVQRKPDPLPEKPPAAPVSAVDLEWTAFDAADDPERARLYFQAGDLYLDKHQNFESAVRCYQQALTFCNTEALELDPNDNWLVMALKRDHRKEK